jgi:alkanesulfonate monooxygenase SsuD/methylene tetrahydromethanopterin reductase-like flavin-dependent oxidoreductase (luciferase family)
MWSENDGPYAGKHYRLAETLNVPPALTTPHLPILIGGGGERKLLRMVAQYADMNNLFPSSPDQIRHKLDALARHCEVQISLLTDEPAQFVESTIAKLVPRLAEL